MAAMGMPPPSVLETDKMSGAIRWRTSARLGFAAGICFPSRITIAMVSFWLNLFLSFTQGAVAENADVYTLILQPGKSYLREEACSSKISASRSGASPPVSRSALAVEGKAALTQLSPLRNRQLQCRSVLSSLFPWVLPQKKSKNHSLSQSSTHFPMVSLLG